MYGILTIGRIQQTGLGGRLSFVKDVSTLIDTHTIMKHSGWGCDASNVYDEELDAKDVKFSDDEQERLFKQ